MDTRVHELSLVPRPYPLATPRVTVSKIRPGLTTDIYREMLPSTVWTTFPKILLAISKVISSTMTLESFWVSFNLLGYSTGNK
jgi:hypothetical protein